MLSAPTILLYFLFGGGVAIAFYLTDRHTGYGERIFVLVSALIFWPIYLPIILASRSSTPSAFATSRAAKDEMDKAINQADTDLSKALTSLEGWTDGLVSTEAQRLRELRKIWPTLAERIREMDRLLAEPEGILESSMVSAPGNETSGPAINDLLQRSTELRRQNLGHLRNMRRQAYHDLMGRLALVRELVSMIHVAKFTGAPAERARELVAQIMAAGEGIGHERLEKTAVDCTERRQSGAKPVDAS